MISENLVRLNVHLMCTLPIHKKSITLFFKGWLFNENLIKEWRKERREDALGIRYLLFLPETERFFIYLFI